MSFPSSDNGLIINVFHICIEEWVYECMYIIGLWNSSVTFVSGLVIVIVDPLKRKSTTYK